MDYKQVINWVYTAKTRDYKSRSYPLNLEFKNDIRYLDILRYV